MCEKTACTSVENMCVSEGVSKSERLSGNIHVYLHVGTVQRISVDELRLLKGSNIFTDSVYHRRLF